MNWPAIKRAGSCTAGLSLAMHVIGWMMLQPRTRPPKEPAARTFSAIEFSIAPPQHLRNDDARRRLDHAHHVEHAARSLATAHDARRSNRHTARSAPPRFTVTPSPEPVETASTTSEPAPQASGDPAERNASIDISPRRAALGWSDEPRPASNECSNDLPSNEHTVCTPEPQRLAAQAELNAGLRAAARADAYLAPRKPPALRRQSDGSYRYFGHVFTAIIHADGHTQFVDGAAAGVDGPGSLGPGVRGHFDITDAIERAMGHEIYTAEKRWFLEQTRQLRASLADAAQIAGRAQARRMLERALERIVFDPNLAPETKRARVLALWSDCDATDYVQDTQGVIERFVRTHMPRSGVLGFSDAELERFNRARPGLTAFDPYVEAATPLPG